MSLFSAPAVSPSGERSETRDPEKYAAIHWNAAYCHFWVPAQQRLRRRGRDTRAYYFFAAVSVPRSIAAVATAE